MHDTFQSHRLCRMNGSAALALLILVASAGVAHAQWQRTGDGDPERSFSSVAFAGGSNQALRIGLHCQSVPKAEPLSVTISSVNWPSRANSGAVTMLGDGEKKIWVFQQGGGFAGGGTSLALTAVDPKGLAAWLRAKGEVSLALNASEGQPRQVTIPAGVGAEIEWLKEKCVGLKL
jgi:hypothetical protein